MRISLKDALFLGFCAIFILSAKAVLRLHLKVPGHSMFFTLFFLLIARGCVRYRMAASVSALLAGVMAIIMGMGKGGPLIVVKFLIPGLVVDLVAGVVPGLFTSIWLCVFAAALAAATRFFGDCLMDYLMGMDPDILLRHAMVKSLGNVLFGMAGGIPVPAVIRKLKAYGAIGGR